MRCAWCGADKNHENALAMLRAENRRLAEQLAASVQKELALRETLVQQGVELARQNERVATAELRARALAESPASLLLRRLMIYQVEQQQLHSEIDAHLHYCEVVRNANQKKGD